MKQKWWVFLNFLLSPHPLMLAFWSLVPLPLQNPAWTSRTFQFMFCWSLTWRTVLDMSEDFYFITFICSSVKNLSPPPDWKSRKWPHLWLCARTAGLIACHWLDLVSQMLFGSCSIFCVGRSLILTVNSSQL